ncbi:imm11 family protein [Achromobacter pestifer]|uniref:Immunity MXAN-0049 protein domain-containing protein n=1 Tax=Achromobacter pestifer TaxID=1353889 RepID=A0A6S6YXB0_9BURK|nr:DUF1629 domain-containing protein [Achromobacter pestifer]CAB3649141.1 hypothetical protein LMG3431_02718 [Achromobacter pestifer]
MKNVMTYLWRVSDDYPQALIGEYVSAEGLDRFSLRRGERLPDQHAMPVVRFSVSGNLLHEFSCLPNSAMLPLVGRDFADFLIENAPDDIQLIEARIQAEDGGVDGFYFVNIISSVTAIDKNESIFTLVPGTDRIMGFKKLRYYEDCLGGHMLARDSEYMAHLLVSNELAEKMKQRNFSGVGLYLPSEIWI